MSAATLTERPASRAHAAGGGGKYLTFALGCEEYGLQILTVREIIGYMDITAVPRTPPYVKGVINLRGQVISVVDLRAKFGMESAERTDQSCIVVVEIDRGDGKISVGVVVDRVSEVLNIPAEQIEAAPSFGVAVETDFILGLGKVGKSVKILLDISKVLNTDVVTELAGLSDKGDSAAEDEQPAVADDYRAA